MTWHITVSLVLVQDRARLSISRFSIATSHATSSHYGCTYSFLL